MPLDPHMGSMSGLAPPGPPVRDLVRWIVYTHLVCVGICLAFTLAERHRLVNASVSEFFMGWFAILFLPGLLSLFACPLALLIVIVLARGSGKSRAIGFISEILLCVAQLFILLPLVQ